MRRFIVTFLQEATAALCVAVIASGGPVSALAQSRFVVDLHVDTGMAIEKGLVLSERNARGHVDVPRMIEGRVAGYVAVAFVSPKEVSPDQWWPQTLALIETIRGQVGATDGAATVVTTEAEARAAFASGSICVVLGVEGGHAIGDDLSRVDTLYARGVRVLTLTWSTGPGWATPSDVPASGGEDAGLGGFGRDVVRCCNDLGIVIDVSHASPRTVADVLRASSLPVMASHSACRAIRDHHRNLTDEQLREIARAGGIIGVPVHPPFVSGRPADETSVADVVDHIEHVRGVAGLSACAIGTDFDGIPEGPRDMRDASDMQRIADELASRGWSEDEIAGVCWRNAATLFARVCR